MAFCERELAQGAVWHVKTSRFALFSCFFCFLPPRCILNNVHWMLFSCVGCFCCWLFCLFLFVSKGKLYLKNSDRFAEHITTFGLTQVSPPVSKYKREKSWPCLYYCTPPNTHPTPHPPFKALSDPRLFLSDGPRAVLCLTFSFTIFGFDDD